MPISVAPPSPVSQKTMAPKYFRKRKRDIDELKREVELDEHRIPIHELYSRMKCDPVKVKPKYLMIEPDFLFCLCLVHGGK